MVSPPIFPTNYTRTTSTRYRAHTRARTRLSFVILIICVLLALTFPHLLKPNIEIVLVFALLVTVILRLIDHFFYDKKYSKTLTYIVIFIFSAFIMYDTKRVVEFSKKCVDGKTGYLDNVIDMFLSVSAMFENILKLEE